MILFVDACSTQFYIVYVLVTSPDDGYLWYGMSGQIIGGLNVKGSVMANVYPSLIIKITIIRTSVDLITCCDCCR